MNDTEVLKSGAVFTLGEIKSLTESLPGTGFSPGLGYKHTNNQQVQV